MKIGTLVASRFEIERLAGAGGMGSVYRARDRETGAPVAVKALHRPDLTAARFEREAEVLAQLEHPGIVRYVAHGRDEEGTAFLAIEWLTGVDLAERLAAGPMTVGEAVAVVRRAAEALGAAHARGVLHRDVKPGNVFLVGGAVDTVKLLDFGIARLGALPGGTRTGALLGTPGYMAPEQARGERDLGPPVDVFALGCVLFECLAGRPAFAGASPMAVLAKVLFDEAPRVSAERPDVPAALDDLVARVLAKSPADRPADGTAVAAALAALGEIDAGAPPSASVPRSRSLSAGEARLASVVLSGGAALTAEDALADTMGGDLHALSVPAPLLALGARVTALADGSLVATASPTASAADQAAQAARVALAMRAIAPAAPIAIATARSASQGGSHLPADAVERAAALLRFGDATAAIRVDEVTAGLLDGQFALGGDAAGRILLGEAEDGGARALLGKATPFVGRTRELITLRGLFTESVEEPAARAALVTAAAGAGKSRLARELCAQIAEQAEMWIARGDPLRAGTPFALAGDLLRAHGGQVAAGTAHLGGEMARAFSAMVAGALDRGPLVLVLDDLHWADLPSLQLVDAALAAFADRPLLVVALARPEVHDLFPRLWEERHVHEIRLAALGRRDAERIARAVLGADAPSATIDRVLALAEGNAFYLEELARTGGDVVPETVLALVEAGLARLDPEARRVLRAASIFGDTFARAGLAALLGDGADLGETIAHLVELEVLARSTRGDLSFRSALLRHAAYGMLTDADRTLGHRLAASWLATATSVEPPVIAEHLERAGEPRTAASWWQRAAAEALAAGDPAAAAAHAARGQRGAEGETAGQLALIEAEVCRWRADTQGAARAARAALSSLSPGGASSFAAVAELSAALGRLGDAEALAALVEEVLALPPRADEQADDVAVLYRTVVELIHLGRYPLAERLLGRLGGVRTVAGAEARALGPAAAAQLGKARAAWATARGDVDAARRETELAIEAAIRAGDRPLVCLMRANLSDAWLALGGFFEAEGTAREALAAAVEAGLAEVAAAARINLGIALARQGRFAEARAALSEALAPEVARDHLRTYAAAAIALADVCVAEGALDEAERRAREAADLAMPIPPLQALAEATLARALLGQRRAPEAHEAAARAMQALAAIGKIEWGEATVRLTWAEALAAIGNEGAAREAIATARDVLAARAAAIHEPAARASFLARVPENAATLARAREWLDAHRRP
jgi:tetratricopeptide (TPR) repeat protein